MMHHSWQFASFGLVLFWVILTPGVITAAEVGGVYDCNPPWDDYDNVTITFRIDRSQYPSKCGINTSSGKPVFQTSPDGNVTYGPNCTVTTDIRTSCTFTPGTIGCGCTNSNDNGSYVVEYNFIFGPDYHRYWEAEVACLDSNTLLPALTFTNTDSNCKPVTSTPPPPPPEPCYMCTCREGCEGWCAGCICLIIVLIIILIVCIYYLVHRLKARGNGGRIPDTPKPTCPPANNKPADSACPDGKPDGHTSLSAPEHTAVHVSSSPKRSRNLPQPKMDGAKAVALAELKSEEEVEMTGHGNSSQGQGRRALPTPNNPTSEGRDPSNPSVTPRQSKLNPIQHSGSSVMTSVERNSYAGPLPSIPSKD